MESIPACDRPRWLAACSRCDWVATDDRGRVLALTQLDASALAGQHMRRERAACESRVTAMRLAAEAAA